jgi:hypothetical protein
MANLAMTGGGAPAKPKTPVAPKPVTPVKATAKPITATAPKPAAPKPAAPMMSATQAEYQSGNAKTLATPTAGATSGKSGAVPVATPQPISTDPTIADYQVNGGGAFTPTTTSIANQGVVLTSPVASATSTSPTTTTSVDSNGVPVQTTTTPTPASSSTGSTAGVSTSGANDLANGALSGITQSVTDLQNGFTSRSGSGLGAGGGGGYASRGGGNSYLTGQQVQAAADLANAATAASAPGASTTTATAPTGISGLLSGGPTKWIIAAAIIGGGIYYYRRQQKGGTMKVGS